jgi:hypothetical protein
MLKEAEVREAFSRLERGEKVKAIPRALGVDRKTIKRWRRVGGWYRKKRKRTRRMDAFSEFLTRQGPEVVECGYVPGALGAGVYRQLPAGAALYSASPVTESSGRSWPRCVMNRSGRARRKSISDRSLCGSGINPKRAHLFAFTLGYCPPDLHSGVPLRAFDH